MSKKLWQAIGIEKNVSDLGEFSEYSTIKIEEGHPPGPNDLSQEIRLFSSEPLHLINRVAQYRSREEVKDGDLDIESCESQGDIERENSPRFLSSESNYKQLKKKLIRINQQLEQLRANNMDLKRYYSEWHLDLKDQLYRFLELIAAKIASHVQNPQTPCPYCQNSHRIIAFLTQHCAQTEQQLRQQTTASQDLPKEALRTVEEGLCEERGQMILRLKAELEEVSEQNLRLKKTLSSVELQLDEVEMEYKQHLFELKAHTDALNELATNKYEKLAQQKRQLESEYLQLKKRSQSLASEPPFYRPERKTDHFHCAYKTFSLTDILPRKSLHSSTGNIYLENSSTFLRGNQHAQSQKYGHLNLDKLVLKVSEDAKGLARSQVRRCDNALSKARIRQRNRGAAVQGELGLSWREALESVSDLRREVRKEIKKSKLE